MLLEKKILIQSIITFGLVENILDLEHAKNINIGELIIDITNQISFQKYQIYQNKIIFNNKTNMITKTIKTPVIINIAFLALLILPILVFLSIKQVSASTVTISYNYCDKIYYDTFVWQVRPEYNRICKNRFQYLTNSIKRSFINYQK